MRYILPSLILLSQSMLANPEPQQSLVRGSIAQVACIKSGSLDTLKTLIQSVPSIESVENLQFYTSRVEDHDVLLATYDGARSIWPKVSQAAPLKSLLAHLVPHPRLGKDSATPWLECETICQLRPSTPTPAATDQHAWHAAVTGLKPDKEADYRNLHNHVWPGVIDAIGASSIVRFDLFLTEFGGKPYLFYSFKYVGKDFDADMKKMAANPVNQRWWKFTDACQQPLPQAAAKKEIWLPIQSLSSSK